MVGRRPLRGGHETEEHHHSTVPPTWPANPQPIAAPSAVAEAPNAGLDWLSAFIGAAAAGLFAIALAGIADLRRRRITRPRSLTTN